MSGIFQQRWSTAQTKYTFRLHRGGNDDVVQVKVMLAYGGSHHWKKHVGIPVPNNLLVISSGIHKTFTDKDRFRKLLVIGARYRA